MKFDQLGLAEPILRAIAADGYETPTPIQAKAIPHVLAGSDLLGCAQTGTGKTAAFALPILQQLMTTMAGKSGKAAHEAHAAPTAPVAHGHRGRGNTPSAPPATGPARPIRTLILCPTRELASQIADSFRSYGRHLPLKHTVIFGGVNQFHQVRALKNGVDIVIATPGRLLDLMQQGHVDLRAVKILVLDEADRMLDMGFIPDIRRIVKQIPASGSGGRQTLLFSATMPDDIRALADSILHKPVSVQVNPVSSTVESIAQSVYFVPRQSKPALLTHLLKTGHKGGPMDRTLVFTRTKRGADKVVKHLMSAGIRAEAIHGNKSQGARTRALASFKSSKPPVLVATDIASRGIDVDEITHVINFDMPDVPETYVHRIGRTARAGASGSAVSFCDHEERGDFKAIERLTRANIEVLRDVPAAAMEAPRAAIGGFDHGHSEPREKRHLASGHSTRPSHGERSGGSGSGAGSDGHRGGGHARRGQGGPRTASGGGGAGAAGGGRPSSKKGHRGSHLAKPAGSTHAGSTGGHHAAQPASAGPKQSFGQRGRGKGRSPGKAW